MYPKYWLGPTVDWLFERDGTIAIMVAPISSQYIWPNAFFTSFQMHLFNFSSWFYFYEWSKIQVIFQINEHCSSRQQKWRSSWQLEIMKTKKNEAIMISKMNQIKICNDPLFYSKINFCFSVQWYFLIMWVFRRTLTSKRH